MRIHTPLFVFILSVSLGCSDRLVVDESNNGVTGNGEDEPEAPASAADDDASESSSDDTEPVSSEDDDVAPEPEDDAAADDDAPEPEDTAEPDGDDDVAPEPENSSGDDDVAAPEPEQDPVGSDGDDAGTSEGPIAPVPMTPSDAGAPDAEGVNECPFDESLTYDPGLAYPFCQWEAYVPPFIDTDPNREPTAFERYCQPLPGGWGYYNWHAEGENSGLCNNDGSCNACNCAVACDYDSPSGCPSGETGNATPTCMNPDSSISGSGDCWLTCDAGEQCPDGTQCVPMPEFGRDVCAWITEGDRCSDEQLSNP